MSAAYTNKKVISSSKGDKYSTPKYAWEQVAHLIPKDKVLWEPFNDGSEKSLQASKDLQSLGFHVISKPYNEQTGENDFFTSNYGDIVVTNPPFSIKKKVLFRLYDLDKPFMLIVPTSTINNQYYKKFREHTQVIIPPKRINFNNFNEQLPSSNSHPKYKSKESNACFDCMYLCWKMNLPKDLIFLE